MKFKRLLSLAGFIAALLIFTGSRSFADDAIAVGNALGYSGGSDTVDVFITTDQAYPAAEITLNYDPAKLSYEEGSLVVNTDAWDPSWGDPQVAVNTTTGELKVAFISFSSLDAQIPQTIASLKLFSVVMNAAAGVAPGTETITPSGIFTTTEFQEIIVTSLSSGSFVIQSSYTLDIADDAEGSFGLAVPVNIYLSNASDAVGVEFTITFDGSQLEYGGTVELNEEIWQNGSPETPEVTASTGEVKVLIFTSSVTAAIPSNNEPRWVAKVYLKSVAGAVEQALNPLTFSKGIVATRDPDDFSVVENTATLLDGNFAIKGKHSLKVSSDAGSPLGGSDTVTVYLKNSETVVGVEAELAFDADNFTVSEGDLVFNKSIFSGSEENVNVEISTTSSTIKVVAFPLSTDSIVPALEEKELFKVILNAKSDATPGYDTLDISGMVTTRDENFVPLEVPVVTATKGIYLISSPFEYQVQNLVGKPKSTQTVNILLTNRDAVVSTELVIKFNADSVSFVEGSVVANGDVWDNGAPDPEVVAGPDSVKIGLIDLTGTSSIAAGGAGQGLVSLDMKLNDNLVNGDTVWFNVSGMVAVRDEDYQVTDVVATGVGGYFAVVQDITPPGAVADAAGVIGENAITISWRNPVDADLTQVVIVRKTDTEEVTVYDAAGIPEAAGTFIDSDISQGVEYTYEITCYDNADNPSETVTLGPFMIGGIVAPDPPVAGEPVAGDGVVTITWTNPEDKEFATFDYVKVYRLAEGVADSVVLLDGEGLEEQPETLTDTTVTNDVTYTYVIYAIDTDGQASEPAVVTATPEAPVPVNNVLKVISGIGFAGEEVIAAIDMYSEEDAIAGISFDVNFDHSKLQITEVGLGANAAGLTLVGLDADAIAEANSSGVISISMVDFTFSSPVPAGDYEEILKITLQISSEAAAGESVPLTLAEASLSNADAEDVPVRVEDGQVDVVAASVVVENTTASVGQDVTVRILTNSPDANIAGAGFTVMFDYESLQIKSTAVGADASALSPVGLDETVIAAANSSGSLMVSLVDFTFSSPIQAGEDRETFLVTFTVGDIEAPATLDIDLDEVSLSDENAVNIAVGGIGGSIEVVSGPDIDGNGVVDGGDLFAYLKNPEQVPVDILAELIAELLAKPIPENLLASARNFAAVDFTDTGVALVSLDTDMEVIVARFTFSYDNSYEVAAVQLNGSLQGKAYIKPMYLEGKLVVDIISLNGLTPASLGDNLFCIQFRNAEYQETGLTLEKVEIADRSGNVYTNENAKVSTPKVLPKAFSLSQNSPNPFNPSTTISYAVPESSAGVMVKMAVYNIRGQKVITLVDELKEAGNYTVNWDGRDLSGSRVSSGVYFYRINAGDFTAVRKMVIVK